MNAEVGLPAEMFWPLHGRVGERREHRDREDADEPERHELLRVRHASTSPRKRRRLAASWRSIDPVAGAATSSPVIGETMRGM